jgi:hypothetical protein
LFTLTISAPYFHAGLNLPLSPAAVKKGKISQNAKCKVQKSKVEGPGQNTEGNDRRRPSPVFTFAF